MPILIIFTAVILTWLGIRMYFHRTHVEQTYDRSIFSGNFTQLNTFMWVRGSIVYSSFIEMENVSCEERLRIEKEERETALAAKEKSEKRLEVGKC